MDEFREHCDGQHIISYVRGVDGHWIENAKSYWNVNEMKQPLRIDPPHGATTSDQQRYGEVSFSLLDSIFLSQAPERIGRVSEERGHCQVLCPLRERLVSCARLCIPKSRQQYAVGKEHRVCALCGICALGEGGTGVHVEGSIRSLRLQYARQVQEELGMAPLTYIVLHWRDGEESCHVEKPEFHEGFDYCTGAGGSTSFTCSTSVSVLGYTWAKSDDVIDMLLKELEETKATAVYIATDTKREYLLYRIRSRVPVKLLSDSSILCTSLGSLATLIVSYES